MESVIGTKMQSNPEHFSAFTAGAYALNGPNGPITPADWDDNIFPGCVVELRLTGPDQTLELMDPRHLSRGQRSPSRAEGSASAAVQLYRPPPLKRIDTDHQIEFSGFIATENPSEHDQPASFGDHDQTIITPGPENSETEPIQASEANLASRHPSPRPQSVDIQGSSFGSFLPPNLDLEPNLSRENEFGGNPKPIRRATDLQSFVEDADDNSSTEKASSSVMTDILSPAEGFDLNLHGNPDRQSTNAPAHFGQHTAELREENKPSRRSESLQSSKKETTSAEVDFNLEKRHHGRDQTKGDPVVSFNSDQPTKLSKSSNSVASSGQKKNLEEKMTMSQSSSGTYTAPLCPIFAWKLEATDGLPSTPSERSEPIPEEYKDMDRTIRAILEERDAEASLYLLKHERVGGFIDSLSECSRSEVLARMKMMGYAQSRRSEAENPARRTSERRRIEVIICNAMEILDAFVPVHYQVVHQYWLIKKFYGALLAFITDEVGQYSQEIGEKLICLLVPRDLS